MNPFKWLMSGGKTVEKITDGVINGADALVYTDEEKAADRAKRSELWFKFMEMARDESSIRSVTRRLLAVVIIGHWLLYLNISLGLYLFDETEKATHVFGLAGEMNLLVAGVGAFYFATHLMRARK